MPTDVFYKVLPVRGNTTRVAKWRGHKHRANGEIVQGSHFLLCPNKLDIAEIRQNEGDMMKSRVLRRAFERILETYKPGHDIALVSICTATRPYSLSRKWTRLLKHFSGKVDFIVQSNAGVIPLEYECCYPYLNYNGPHEDCYNKQYIETQIQNEKLFFEKFHYRHVVFHFRHKVRDYHIAKEVGPWAVEKGYIGGYTILPTETQYNTGQAEGFVQAGYSMFPELWPTMFDPLVECIEQLTSAGVVLRNPDWKIPDKENALERLFE